MFEIILELNSCAAMRAFGLERGFSDVEYLDIALVPACMSSADSLSSTRNQTVE